jgi:hypothetical protein
MKVSALLLGTVLVASFASAKAAEPSAFELGMSTSQLVKQGDFRTLEARVLEWRGQGGQLPIASDGQSKLSALNLALNEHDASDTGAWRKLEKLLIAWQDAMPNSPVLPLMWVHWTSCALEQQKLPKDPLRMWQRMDAALAQAEKVAGRTADWYDAYIEAYSATDNLADDGILKEKPPLYQHWQLMLAEGLQRFPQHTRMYLEVMNRTGAFQLSQLSEDANECVEIKWGRKVMELAPQLGMEPLTRCMWLRDSFMNYRMFEGEYARPWDLFAQGMEQILQRYPGSSWNLNHYLSYAHRARDKALAQRLLKEIGDKPDPRVFAVEARFADIKRWATDSAPEKLPLWRFSRNKPESVYWSLDGQRVYVGGRWSWIHVLNPATGAVVKEFGCNANKATGHAVLRIQESPDGRYLAAVSGKETYDSAGTCKIWSLPALEAVDQFTSKAGNLHGLCWARDSKQLIAGGGKFRGPSELYHWQLGQPLKALDWAATHKHSIDALVWTPDDTKVMLNCGTGHITVGNAGGGIQHVKQVSVPGLTDVADLDISPDGQWVLAGLRLDFRRKDRANGCIGLYRAADMKPRTDVLAPLTGGILCARFSPDGSRIAAVGYDRLVYILNVATLEVEEFWNAECGRLSSVAWSPDGTKIVVGGWDSWVSAWSVSPVKKN